MTIDVLNDDILREIFEVASRYPRSGRSLLGGLKFLQPSRGTTTGVTSFQMDIAVTLSHVSSRWRGVALTTPSLWTAFRAALPVTPARNEMIETCLTRAGSARLSVEIRVPHKSMGLVSTGLPRMTFPFDRCDALAITGLSPSEFDWERFDLGRADFGSALRASRFYLPSILHISALTISWMIVGMNEDMMDVPELCSLLQSCRQLRRLSLHGVELMSARVGVPVIVELPTISTLHAYYERMDLEPGGLEVLGIMSHDYRITLPSLHTLDIEATLMNQSRSLTAYQSVRRLILRTERTSQKHATHFICVLRALEELTLDANIVEEDGIPSELSPPFLTRIDLCNSFGPGLDKVVRFLVAGMTTAVLGAGSLQYVDLSRCELSAGVQDWIAECVPMVRRA